MDRQGYMIKVIQVLISNLRDDNIYSILQPENEYESMLAKRTDDFLKELMSVVSKSGFDKEIEYVLDKIYAFYNAEMECYCAAYLWERTSNELFPRISVGCYRLVRSYMNFLEDYKNGRL